jgi:hypothetical protein
MPPMHRRPGLGSPGSLLASWLAAAAALPASLLISAAGQGAGAVAVGGGWIGVCTPWNRQVWALVNQPVLNFASLSAAGGYWLGSWMAPFLLTVLMMPLSLRLKTASGQLAAIQSAWIALVVAASWHPSLDPHTGHIARWLQFQGLPTELRWLTIAAAAAAAVPIALRLLAIARITRFHLGRGRRLALVIAHLFPVPVGLMAVTIAVEGAAPIEACIAAGIPLAATVGVAWFGFPAPLTHPVAAVTPRALITLGAAALLAWTCGYATGRPLPDNRAAAVQWAREGSFNNIRDWMEPWRAPWLDPAVPPPG